MPLAKVESLLGLIEEKEKALKVERDLLYEVFCIVPIPLALVRPDGVIKYGNRMLSDTLGYPYKALEGLHFIDITHTDSAEEDIRLFREMAEGKNDGYYMRKKYVRKDGSVIEADLTVGRVRDKEGRIAIVPATFSNIKEVPDE